MTDAAVIEREWSQLGVDFYEVRARCADGRVLSRVFVRSPLTGWPHDYKRRAHDEVRAAALTAGGRRWQS